MSNLIVRAWRRFWLCHTRWPARHPGSPFCFRHRWHPGDCAGLIAGTWELGADGYRCWIPSKQLSPPKPAPPKWSVSPLWLYPSTGTVPQSLLHVGYTAWSEPDVL